MSYFKSLSLLVALTLTVSNSYADTCVKPDGINFKGRSEPRAVSCVKDGLAIYVGNGGRYGYVNANGNVVINAQFSDATSFHKGSAMVRYNHNGDRRWKLINKNGNTLINNIDSRDSYDPYYKYSNRFFDEEVWYMVWRDDKVGVINPLGEQIVPIEYDWIGLDLHRAGAFAGYNPNNAAWDEKAGVVKVKKAGKYGVIDRTGKEVIPATYTKIWMPAKPAETEREKEVKKSQFNGSTGLIALKQDDDILFYDIKSRQILPERYDSFYDFGEDLTRVKKDNKIGFINQRGQVVIAPKYDDAWNFSANRALVKVGDKYGYINKQDDMAIAPKYDGGHSFDSTGKAKVTLRDGYYPITFTIDNNGKPLVNRVNLTQFRDNLEAGDETSMGLVLETKGKLALLQIERNQCSQQNSRNQCVNYIRSVDTKWVKKDELYPN